MAQHTTSDSAADRTASVQLVQQLVAEGKTSASELAKLAGVPRSTINRWLKHIAVGMTPRLDVDPHRTPAPKLLRRAPVAGAFVHASPIVVAALGAMQTQEQALRITDRARERAKAALALNIEKKSLKAAAKARACADRLAQIECELPGVRLPPPAGRVLNLIEGNRGLFVSAVQNATPVHKAFADSLDHFLVYHGYGASIIGYRYKNPTSRAQEEAAADDDWYDSRVAGVLSVDRLRVCNTLEICADVKIQSTTPNPLTGLEEIPGPRSGIFGGPRYEYKTVPTMTPNEPRELICTGTMTRANYSDTKAGKRAEAAHRVGGVVIELDDDGLFHHRRITADEDGSFIDCGVKFTPTGVVHAAPGQSFVEAIYLGDGHVKHIDPVVKAAMFDGAGSAVGQLKPAHLIWSDLVDMDANKTRHDRRNFLLQHRKHHTGRVNVRKEIMQAMELLDEVLPSGCTHVIVPSNLGDHFLDWFHETDWRTDPENADLVFELGAAGISTEHFDPLKFMGQKYLKKAEHTRFLSRGESLTIAGIQVNLHEIGANGARTTTAGFAKLGFELMRGHPHSAAVIGRATSVGTLSEIPLAYAAGSPCGWTHSSGIIYKNGTSTLMRILKNGRFRPTWAK